MHYYTCPDCGAKYARSDFAHWEHVCEGQDAAEQSYWLSSAKRALNRRDPAEALRDAEALLEFVRKREPRAAG